MKITTWNIRHGGGNRINEIIKWIGNHDTDYFVITEYRNNENGVLLSKALAKCGYSFQITPKIEKNKNTLMIASKREFTGVYFHNELGYDCSRVIKVEDDEIIIYGVYFPQKNEKKKIFEFLLNEMNRQLDKTRIFIGDFNTGKPYIDEEKKTFYCSEYMDVIEKSHIDAWRYINKNKREYSWYSNLGNGFRVDHVFINQSDVNKIAQCFYLHEKRIDKTSDHSIMEVELV
ncbi:MAG: hypothetical protein EOL98_01385 [Negativicutes bacterium]|nr:hypothetical protein [Negativicutes bacterium]